MRLFTAIEIPPDLNDGLKDRATGVGRNDVMHNLIVLLDRLRPAAKLSWTRPENLHITTKFIGEWPEARLPELHEAVALLPDRPVIEVTVSGVGFYPHERAPRVFWCGIEAPGLAALAADTDAVTASLGVARENRAYSPHLTLARVRDRQDMRPLQSAISAIPSLDFGRFTARSFFLFRSELRPAGSVYTKIAEFPFSKR